MRPIDADRLLKTIANLDVECADQKQASIMLNTIQKVFPQIVNDEPTLEAEHGHWVCIEAEPDNGWISVKDRLPEPMTMVLVHNTDGKIFTVIYKNDYLQFITGYTITHWQPLPKPPKGE